MAGIETLWYGGSLDESVHNRWSTGKPSDWNVQSLGDVYAHLLDIDEGEERGYHPDAIYEDAALIWDWLQGSRNV